MLGTEKLYTAAQTRALDKAAIEGHGVPGIRLMARAARATFEALLELWPEPECVQVVCGTGNNGGDGFLVADLAHNRGIPAVVYQIGDPGKIRGDALEAREQAVADGVKILPWAGGVLEPRGVIVDAMLGTGLVGGLLALLTVFVVVDVLPRRGLEIDVEMEVKIGPEMKVESEMRVKSEMV